MLLQVPAVSIRPVVESSRSATWRFSCHAVRPIALQVPWTQPRSAGLHRNRFNGQYLPVFLEALCHGSYYKKKPITVVTGSDRCFLSPAGPVARANHDHFRGHVAGVDLSEGSW